MKLETKIEYLKAVHMPLRVLYWLGCMRFGEEKLRMSRYQKENQKILRVQYGKKRIALYNRRKSQAYGHREQFSSQTYD